MLLEVSSHQLEVAETLIGVGRFLGIFVVARAIAELVGGVLIGASGLHLIVLPEGPGQPDAQALDPLPGRCPRCNP